MPLLFALNDYLGCLLLVSRSLELDAEYPQALALQYQISKEDKNLIQNFKFFFPEEKSVTNFKMFNSLLLFDIFGVLLIMENVLLCACLEIFQKSVVTYLKRNYLVLLHMHCLFKSDTD